MPNRDFMNDGELRRWILEQTESGQHPDQTLSELAARGLTPEAASEAMTRVLEERLLELRNQKRAGENSVPDDHADALRPLHRPEPLSTGSGNLLRVIDRDVRVVFRLERPRMVLFEGFLSNAECEELITSSRRQMSSSQVIDIDTGGEKPSDERTSSGTALAREGTPTIARIERRIAALLNWPLQNGEAIQVLRYDIGQEYKPHYDFVDPALPGSSPFLQRGGQRVASFLMYLNTPNAGGSTSFPDLGLDMPAVKGNALFFAYDCAHPSSRTLHAGMPVSAGEKWIATKWLRENAHA